MKKEITFYFILILIFSFRINAKEYQINKLINKDTILYHFNEKESIYGIWISGYVELISDSSLIRIILQTDIGEEYLIFESHHMINLTDTFNFYSQGEETKYLSRTTPLYLKVEIVDANLTIFNFNTKDEPNINLDYLKIKHKNSIDSIKINNIKNNIHKSRMLWFAGKTIYSQLPYSTKKLIFGEKYNIQGFEYYNGGIFTFFSELETIAKEKQNSTIVESFDWRTRHNANNPSSPYWDGDPDWWQEIHETGNGWLTSVKDQQIWCPCPATCYIYGPIAALEGLFNIYYNQHIDLNLSEQHILSCDNFANGCNGGSIDYTLNFIRDIGVCDDNCFPWAQAELDCDDLSHCTDPLHIVTISNYVTPAYSPNFDLIKESIINYGPLQASMITPNAHSMALIGFGKIHAGDIIQSGTGWGPDIIVDANSPLVGKTYWIFKNSVGPTFGQNGYVYLVTAETLPGQNHLQQIRALLNPTDNITTYEVLWGDEDGDGYYWWGIGPKPTDCPGDPNQEDCDDSDPILGPYDENYYCTCNCDNFIYSSTPIEITSDENWNDYKYINSDLIVKSGNTLTIREKISFIKQAKIIIEPGAKLILDGGTLTNACGTMWQGIEVWGNKDLPQYPQSNQGVVELKNGATIKNARCAITTCQKDTVGNILWNYTGGIIHAKDAHFINNRKAIEFLSYHNILPNGREIDNSSYFNNCNFETNAQLSDPGTLPETFVSLNDVKGVKFLGCTFQNIAPTGVYSTIHRGNGITSIDANYEVKPLCLNPYIYPCSEYQPNTFQNLYYGIYASNTNPAITLTISVNNFDNNHRSIFLKSINNATITKNNFDIGATIGNINDQTNEREACDVFNRSYSYGVYLKECSGYKVEENNFSTTHDGHAGIIVDNSGTKANEIYNNTFDKLAIGTQAQGINAAGGVIISKSSNPEHIEINVGQGLQFLCNQYFNISTADIAVTSGRIAQNQGYCRDNNPALPAGNKFSHTCNISTSDIHVNSDASKFNYSHHSELDYIPLCYSSDKVTLHDCHIKYDPRTSCPSHLNSGLTPVVLKQIINTNKLEIEELISLIDNGETETLLAQIHQNEEPERIKNALESASPYLSDRVLLAAIKEKPKPLPLDILKEIIISNSPVTDTVMSALNTLKLPDDIQQQIQEVQKGTSARAALEQQVSYMETQKDIAENELMRQYLNDTIINGTDSIIAYLETQRDLINKKQLVQAYLVANQCEKAKILLGQLPQENDEDKNFYNFYNLLSDLCVSEKSYFELTSAQEQTVREIAKSETSVSVNAQAILSLVYNEKFPEIIEELKFIVDLRNAPQQGETLGDNITKQIQFVKIYPNPAENTITIELSAELDNKNISVEIYNYLGQKIIFYNFAGDLLNTLDVSDLSNGIYIFKILVGNKIIAREKVVIEK